MFDAAHAALLRVNADLNPATIKTHRGLIAAFGERLVKAGRTTLDLGRSLNQVEQVRLLADYTREAIHLKKAQWSIDQAETFIAAMQLLGLRTWVAPADFAVPSNAGAGILETWHEMAGNRRRRMLIFLGELRFESLARGASSGNTSRVFRPRAQYLTQREE